LLSLGAISSVPLTLPHVISMPGESHWMRLHTFVTRQ
jgi:hypothetical protein